MTNIEKILDYLHNRTARVSAPGILIEGTLEQTVRLEFFKNVGLLVYASLEYNTTDISTKIHDFICENREMYGISYESRDKILDSLMPFIKQSEVRIANINYYTINKIDTEFDSNGNITSMVLNTIDNNNKIYIKNIK